MAVEVYPIPRVPLGRIMGFLEILDDRGGKDDIYRVAKEVKAEFGEVLNILKAAEILGFIDTPGGDVVLLDLGKKLLLAEVTDKKEMVRQRLLGLNLFKYFMQHLKKQPEQRWGKRNVLKSLKRLLPNENPEQIFLTLVDWARYGELFGYSPDEETLYLAAPEPPAPSQPPLPL